MSQTKAQLIDGQGEINLGGLDIDASAPDGSVNLDSSGRLLVGTSSSTTVNTADSAFQIVGTDFSKSSILIRRSQNTIAGPGLTFASSDGTIASPTSVADDDTLGIIRFHGYDGSDFNSYGAEIACYVDDTPGAGDMPGRLVFSTTADGSSSPTEQLYIYNNGNLRSPRTYNLTTASAANGVVDGLGYFKRSTSSSKYKNSIETAEDAYSDAILNCRPVWYRSTCDGDNPSHSWWGFIAEEVAEIDPRLVHWKTTESVVQEDGSRIDVPCDPEPEGVQYERFVPHLLNLIKRQKEQIETQGTH